MNDFEKCREERLSNKTVVLYRDLATTLSGAKILIRYNGVSGSSAVGNLRPITQNSRRAPLAFIFTQVKKDTSYKPDVERKRMVKMQFKTNIGAQYSTRCFEPWSSRATGLKQRCQRQKLED